MQVQPKNEWSILAETITSLFEETRVKYADRTYISSDFGQMTYADASTAIEALAAEISANVRGRVVGIHLTNSPSFLITYFSVLRAGGKPALINAATPVTAIAKMLSGADVAFVFASQDVPGLTTRLISDAYVLELSKSSTGAGLLPALPVADDIGAILFSGGTTGLPKRIAHSHRAVIAKMERMEWGWPTDPNETWLPVAPFTHIYGYLMGVVNPILKGGKVVIPERFKPDLVVDLMARERVTVFGGGPPAIYQGLMAAEDFAAADLSALRVCPGGGAPFPVATHEKWQELTGLKIHEGLGMTEIAPLAVNQMPDAPRYGSVGRACPDTDIEIVDVETGTKHMPVGVSGEIRVRGPHMMAGYEGNPGETSATMRDGFIYTGDIGSLSEDGYLTITDRKKDVIFHKGFNVFPREIEETLMELDAVSQVCVVGREDDRAGEVAVVFVAGNIDARDVIEHCKSRLSAYKVPSEVCFVDQMPLTANGKLDRVALRSRPAP